MKKAFSVLFILLFISCFAQQKSSSFTETEILAFMDKNAKVLLENSKANSVSIGVVKDGKTYTKHYGEIDKGKGNQANNNTVFEVASITKLFTGLLVAQAVVEGKISPEDDIRKYLTGSYPNLEYNGTPIKIKDLVSFRTGFSKDLPDTSELRKKQTDSSYIAFKKMDDEYSRTKFFEDLKTMKLDTLPGTKFKYSNGSLQVAAHILENVYHKSYETLLKENILSKLNMNSTYLNPDKSVVVANGYDGKKLMPNISDNLWGAAGYLKSTLSDLTKFIIYELNTKNKIVQESQKNILNSDTTWNGYFWDHIQVDNFGRNCWKHGGAFGTQNMLLVYPESNLGISIIVNISNENTGNALGNAIINLTANLISKEDPKKMPYGYKLTKDNVIFTYRHNKTLDADLVKSVSIAGTFNNWNPADKNYQMIRKDKYTFELSIPKSQFEKDKNQMFKFVINKTGWLKTPKNTLNIENGPDQNLLLKIE
ncbi:CubicO group peptidase, beta-lactamase class C family [Flavobacterium sp. CF108]|uniref:serine hydrolase n=1 Tax=unclassified Flavobacterium TaxID=196869 RepID=UPI0008CF7FA2|nr:MULTISPECIES: serine hydrolase [unclassified Flavobacterium]SEO29219.1 CubicO group peptidase, beta-lactamase class C family [Flavobacterium sp. fv08]SHG43597.1 CubicO group peptidase, beta-lactamase class C family [Flavobacterium sp. CF108]